jgi:hypothetical protein
VADLHDPTQDIAADQIAGALLSPLVIPGRAEGASYGAQLRTIARRSAAPREECCEFSTTGKSPKAVKSSSQKYFALPEF